MSTAWNSDRLDRVGDATELHLASRRDDGSLRRYVTMWVVRAGNDLYVRSAHGPDNPWYRRAIARGRGRIRAVGIEADVSFERADDERARRDRCRLPREVRQLRTTHCRQRRRTRRPPCHDPARAGTGGIMSDVSVVIGAGSIGQAIGRRVSAGKQVLMADLRHKTRRGSRGSVP